MRPGKAKSLEEYRVDSVGFGVILNERLITLDSRAIAIDLELRRSAKSAHEKIQILVIDCTRGKLANMATST